MIEKLHYKTTSDTDVIDITDDISKVIEKSGLKEGIVVIFCPGSTASITTIEYEPNVIKDFKEALQRLFPSDKPYHHDKTWGDGNGYSHVRASFLKPNISIPFSNGKLLLGTWQQVVLVDFDNRPRTRLVIVKVGAF